MTPPSPFPIIRAKEISDRHVHERISHCRTPALSRHHPFQSSSPASRLYLTAARGFCPFQRGEEQIITFLAVFAVLFRLARAGLQLRSGDCCPLRRLG